MIILILSDISDGADFALYNFFFLISYLRDYQKIRMTLRSKMVMLIFSVNTIAVIPGKKRITHLSVKKP